MITYNQQGIIKYDIKHVIFLFRTHHEENHRFKCCIFILFFGRWEASYWDLYLLYFIYFLCIYVKTFYVFHLWALHIVTCTYKYICVSLYSVYVFMCVCF